MGAGTTTRVCTQPKPSLVYLNAGEAGRMILSRTESRGCVLHFRRGKGGPRQCQSPKSSLYT